MTEDGYYEFFIAHNSEYLIKLSSDSNVYVYLSKLEKMEIQELALLEARIRESGEKVLLTTVELKQL